MPELDYAALCDYVRLEGVAHALGIGIDTIYAPAAPTAANVGLLARFSFTRAECGRPHRVEVIFQGEDGERLLNVQGVVSPERPDGLPLAWKSTVPFAVNLGLQLPDYGEYAFEIMLNDSSVKSIPLRVVPPQDQQSG